MRVWEVLHTVATGLAASGDVAGAARLVGAIGDRRLTFVPESERQQLQSLLEASLGDDERARHERAGRELDLGRAVAEALERIERARHVVEPRLDPGRRPDDPHRAPARRGSTGRPEA